MYDFEDFGKGYFKLHMHVFGFTGRLYKQTVRLFKLF